MTLAAEGPALFAPLVVGGPLERRLTGPASAQVHMKVARVLVYLSTDVSSKRIGENAAALRQS